MVEVHLKPDSARPRWYVSEDINQPASPVNRWRMTGRTHAWRPPTDVFEIETAIIVRVEIAGMREEDFSIALSDRYLVIRGQRPDVSERRAYHQMEIFFGEFMCEVELPVQVVADEVSAEYHAGFLRVTLPKARPKKIELQD